MKIGIVEEPCTARHGVYLGTGRVRPLGVTLTTLTNLDDVPTIGVLNPSLFEVRKGAIVTFDLVDGVYVLITPSM